MNIYDQLKAMIAAMEDMILPGSNPIAKSSTPYKKIRSSERQNHGNGESKSRRMMAAKSNRINRKRVKGWKH